MVSSRFRTDIRCLTFDDVANSMFGAPSSSGFGASMFGTRPAGGVTSFPTATATANVQTLGDFFRQFAGVSRRFVHFGRRRLLTGAAFF